MSAPEDLHFARLLNWAEGRLSEEETARIAAAVAIADQETRDTVEWIGQFLRASRAMPLHTPPAELSERLRQSFAEHMVTGSRGPYSEAMLLHDTRLPSAAAGMRTSSTDEVVHLVLGTELGRLLMDVVRVAPGLLDIRGVVLFDEAARNDAVELSFLHDRVLRGMVRSGGDGQFEVREISDQIDELWVTQGDVRVRASLSFQS